MASSLDALPRSLLALDRLVLDAADFTALAAFLVDWAMQAGVDAACVGLPDEAGLLHPGPLAGEGIQDYLKRARLSIRAGAGAGAGREPGPPGRAWQTRRPQVGALPAASWRSPRGASGVSPAGATSWRACAAVPLTPDGQTGGVLVLFARDADHFAPADWAAALEHIGLVAQVVLDRQRLRAEQDNLRELALRDALTGLPNMTALARHLKHAVPRAQRAGVPLVIGLLDLDRFKPVNDLFGHEAGDCVLREIAVRLQDGLRAGDFVARLAGDEFVIVLEGVRDPVTALGPFLERLRAHLTKPVPIGDTSWECGVSLGLALWPDAQTTSSAGVLAEADRAMRESKMQRGTRAQWWTWASPQPAPAKEAGAHSATATGLYGDGWTPALTALSGALQRNAAGIVNDFYLRLAQLPKSRLVLDELTERELQHLKAQQIQNLFALARANLSEAEHRTMALRIGRIHAMVGLDREELVRSRGILAAAVHGQLENSVSRDALTVFGRRLNRDLAWQTEAYQQLQDECQHVLLRLARLAWKSGNYADLIHGAVTILGTFDEVAGCSIGRPDRHGVFRVEAASGRILERQPAGRAPEGRSAGDERGLADFAWRSRTIERCVNVATDPRMAPWRELATREGLRSGIAIPLCQPDQVPMAILVLYSAFPGGYASADQMAFTDLVQTLLAFALSRIANRQGPTHAIPQATRRRWAALLRSDALQMYCQPILDVKTGCVTKVEMLARLCDGPRLLTPPQFLPVLTSDDLLELYVRGLEQALSHRARWLREGHELNVAMNLPSIALGDARYFDATRRALMQHRCPPGTLALEIIEPDALASGLDTGAELARFRALGVTFAEDDLGAGHSSLMRLHELPFDWIRIDRGIVDPGGKNTSGILNFIHQLTRLGHALGKSVIVDGIEDDALFEAAVILQADAVQGSRIARPMPASQLGEWMACRPAPPAPTAPPRSALGKLARLLIWEERLHLVLSDPGAFGQIASLLRATPAASGSVHAPPTRQPFCEACPLTRFFTDIEAVLHDEMADSMQRQALLDAALTYGTGSTAYGLARQRLIDTFEARVT